MFDFSDLMTERTKDFTGREWVFHRINDWLAQEQSRVFLLTGGPGSGKSTLAARLVQMSQGTVPAGDYSHLGPEWLTYVHFCEATNDRVLRPLRFVEALSHQLANRYQAFALALAQVGEQEITINSTQTVNKAEKGAEIKNVVIESLHIGNLSPRIAFNRIVAQPLEQLCNTEFNEIIVILVDALDEAMTYDPEDNIMTLLADLTDHPDDVPPQVRFLLTSRPDPRVLHRLGESSLDLMHDAPDDVSDVQDYAFRRLHEVAEPRRSELAHRIADIGQGNFLYARYVLDDLVPDIDQVEDLNALTLPKGLDDVYHQFLKRELGRSLDTWDDDYAPFMGILTVAREEGLMQTQLACVTGQRESKVRKLVRTCAQYLAGPPPDGPFRIYHQSFRDFLLNDEDYKIYPSEAHQDIAEFYWNEYHNNWRDCDLYGLRHLAAHLTETTKAKSKPEEYYRWTERLVNLVLDKKFQQAHIDTLDDLFAFQQNLEKALNSAVTSTHPNAPPLVINAVLGLMDFRHQHLRAEQIFELARKGDIEAAKRRLLLFPVESQWRKAALLTIAWLAAETNHDAACELQQQVGNESLDPWPLYRLMERLDSDLNDSSLPPLDPPLPPAPDVHMIQSTVAHMGGLKGKLKPEFVSGIQFNEAIMQSKNPSDNEELFFVAAHDGPLLVAYAVAAPDEGNEYFEQYVNIHAANNYIHYRNLSLWILLDAVLRHPDQIWTRSMVEKLIVSALTVDTIAFQEGLSYTITALQALAGEQDKVVTLEARQAQTYTEITQLRLERGQNDSWGMYKRRLAALAEAFTLLPDKKDQIPDLLNRIRDIPRGFAGYESSTWLTLAETFRMCQGPKADTIAYALDRAEESAHNIQDSVFCARSTACVAAMRERWGYISPEQVEIRTVIADFVQTPDAPEFTTLHKIGETYEKRDTTEGKLSLAYDLLEGKSLRQLAEAYRYPLPEFLRVNHEQHWEPDEMLLNGTMVNVPDHDFAPLLAACFAAEILVHPDLSQKERSQLIQLLVPIARQNPTALDTVLSRLLLAARPSDETILSKLAKIAAATGN